MKAKTCILLLMNFSLAALAQTPAKPVTSKTAARTYSEEEFLKKVSEEVLKKVDQIKNKSMADLTKELLAKEEALRLKELDVQKREDQIKVNSKELENKIKAFGGEQSNVLGCLQKNDEDQKARVTQQVEVISNMQPAKAAQLLSVQEPDLAVRILQELDPKKTSKIFNLMEKEVSARLQKQYMSMKR